MAIWLPGEVQVGSGVSEAQGAFVATLASAPSVSANVPPNPSPKFFKERKTMR